MVEGLERYAKESMGLKKGDYIENFIFDASLSSRLISYSI